ncbi:MAG TPA: efflux RND transporter periplasmic adaptor subunit [Sandaracinaceae bacterium]
MRRALVCIALLAACEPEAAPDGRHERTAHEEGEHEEREHDGLVRVDPAALETAGIRIGTVERRALSGGAQLPGEVRFDPLSTAHVSPLVAGRFERVDVELGQRVSRGDVLAVLSSADVSHAQANLAAAQARLRAAESALERQRTLVEEGIGARRGLVEAEAEARQLRAEVAGLRSQLGVVGSRGQGVRLVAPISGIVVQVHATPGEAATPGEEAFTIADPEAVAVYGQVPELAVARVREGLRVLFRPHAFPDLALPGTIQYVAPAIEERTRSLPIRVALERIDPRLRSGMFGGIELVGDEDRPVAVPVDAVVTIEGAPSVFVPAGEEGVFRHVPVRLGRRAGAYYEIESGLSEGDAVVVEGAFTLKSAHQAGELGGHEH